MKKYIYSIYIARDCYPQGAPVNKFLPSLDTTGCWHQGYSTVHKGQKGGSVLVSGPQFSREMAAHIDVTSNGTLELPATLPAAILANLSEAVQSSRHFTVPVTGLFGQYSWEQFPPPLCQGNSPSCCNRRGSPCKTRRINRLRCCYSAVWVFARPFPNTYPDGGTKLGV